jgi:hypothetical protein
MKLADYTNLVRENIQKALSNKLGRMGITSGSVVPIATIHEEFKKDRRRVDEIYEVFVKETGTKELAFEKLVDEFTFTLFNRIAALKVMEAHVLLPEVVTKRSQYGDRSFAHFAWLESNPEGRNQDADGLLPFFEFQFEELGRDIPLFSLDHPYHLLPTPLELLEIVFHFNQVEEDSQVEPEIWKSDDILGWLYESYNSHKKKQHKEDGVKTEYNKVSIQSQVYTPKWVVKFLVDNSLGKLYLEMYPDSEIRNKYAIANAPKISTRAIKPLHEIHLIDPSNGSGNFLLYSFDLFYDLYLDQIDNYGADYEVKDIPKWIIEHNLHGVDLDDRAIQLAQLGLLIKAKRKRKTIHIDHFNVVSSDFFLPDFDEVVHLFEGEKNDEDENKNTKLPERHRKIIEDVWSDLQNAYKFGSLVRLEEKLSLRWFGSKSVVDKSQISIFGQENIEDFEKFKIQFLNNLQRAMAENAARQGYSFLNSQTKDAITYLKILTQKYEVAVANPPYTDSSDFGPELKKFIESNYKQPYKFNTNLYATFIKRSSELVVSEGFIGMLHPLTFMYIATFNDVRKYILKKTKIEILSELGLGGVFSNSDVQADVVAYILKNSYDDKTGLFLDFKKYKNHAKKPEIFAKAYDDLINNVPNPHNYTLSQNCFREIEGWPFIYWISDGFRMKFEQKALGEFLSVRVGLKTGNNDRFLRLWWEIDKEKISSNYQKDKRKWVPYSKGGPFNKWSGNLWAVVNWENDGKEIIDWCKYLNTINTPGGVAVNRQYYLREGLTYSASGSKGASFRYLPKNCIFDVGGSSIFLEREDVNLFYSLALLNSNLSFYLADCLNPTVNVQVGDLKRIPFIIPSQENEDSIFNLANENIEIKKQLCSYRVIESNFNQSPVLGFQGAAFKDRVLAYLNFENAQHTKVLINEAIINELIFKVYELSDVDREQVEAKMGLSIGSMPVVQVAKKAFLEQLENSFPEVTEHIQNLLITTFDELQVREFKEGFGTLYQSNNDLEEFCISHQVNPINVWYWFREANILPEARAAEIALEFLADTIRTLLKEDEDGIIPLVGLPGEDALSQRLEQHCLENGFTSAQYLQLDGLLGRPINEFLEFHFFYNFSFHLKLFKQLPATPFIWHLSSGPHQGIEVYTLIYKWNRDSLFKLKSQYISQRVQNLEYRQIQLQGLDTAQAQNEKEKIRFQLQEIEVFKTKIDELIAEGYDPKLDDGVGKNIAPLQKKGLLRAEVLKTTGGAKSQLEKYLNADW